MNSVHIINIFKGTILTFFVAAIHNVSLPLLSSSDDVKPFLGNFIPE